MAGRVLLFLLLLAGKSSPAAFALQGNDNCHDPSSIVKDGSKYWVFTTGAGIYGMYSTDLVNWQSGSRPVFANNTWPSWINSKVPGFAGTFWAPECIYRNGKFYLYYSCSTFGSNVSTIGLATNVTLDPASSSYNWVDQGEVVSSASSSTINAIDPAVTTDASGGLWMTYGSFFKGIGLIKLDGTTGKRSGTSFYWLAGNVSGTTRNNSGSEAPYIVRNGSYYYLFINKGACCNGASSTYYIQVGRSTSITGPYVDKNGVDLNNNGGTTLIATSGNYVGPGHVGLYQEGGANFLTHHYYDANDNGRARLSVGNMGWDGSSWPFITRDWLATGRYQVANVNSAKVWDSWGCTGAQGQAVAQGTSSGATCQKWNFTPVGNGEYKITSAVGAGLAVDVLNNSPANGAVLQLYPYSGIAGQRFKIERTNTGTYVFSSVNGNRVVEVPACSGTAGVQLALYDYLGNNCQKWAVTAASARPLATVDKASPQLRIYPNPAVGGQFTVALDEAIAARELTVTLANAQGQQVYARTYRGQASLAVTAPLAAGIYVVQVKGGTTIYTQKIVVE
jgi:arabinan endo-1,5-alpha-L-arabinosidase